MAKFRDEVEIILSARDEATRELRKVQQEVKKTQEGFGGDLVKNALRAVSAFGAMELGLAGVNVAAEALSGNMEDAAAAVEQLPAGIGPFARQLKEVVGGVSGLRSEIAQIEAVNRAMDRSLDRQKQAVADILKIQEARADVERKIRDELELIRASEEDRAEIKARQSERDSVESAQRQLAEARRLRAAGGITDEDSEVLRANRSEMAELKKFINDPDLFDAARRQSLIALGASGLGLIRSNAELIAEAERKINAIRKENVRINRVAEERSQEAVRAAQERLQLERELVAEGRSERERQATEAALVESRKREEAARGEADARIREAERAAEQQLRIEQQLTRELQRASEERQRANIEGYRGFIREQIEGVQGIASEIGEELSSLDRRRATVRQGSSEVRFTTGVADQAAERERQELQEQRQHRRRLEREQEKTNEFLDELRQKLADPETVLIPAKFKGGQNL